MAYSVQKTKWSQNNPTERVKTNEFAGRVRIAYATYEASAEQSTIEMFNLPNGARIIRGYLGHDALGSSTTLSVGYAAHTTSAGATVALDVDEYKAAAASLLMQLQHFQQLWHLVLLVNWMQMLQVFQLQLLLQVLMVQVLLVLLWSM